jgi:hypothetical protein
MRSPSFICLALFLLPCSAFAQSVQINYGGLDFRTSSDTSLIDGNLVLLLANVATPTTAGTGFGSTLSAGPLNVGDLFNGTYQILGRTVIDTGFGTTGSVNLSLTSGLFPNLSTGDQLAVVWFPTLTNADLSMMSGVSYGLYSGASSSWWVPAAGGTVSLSVPDGTMASFVSVSAIPEPSTYAAIFGGLALGFATWRRRGQSHTQRRDQRKRQTQ